MDLSFEDIERNLIIRELTVEFYQFLPAVPALFEAGGPAPGQFVLEKELAFLED